MSAAVRRRNDNASSDPGASGRARARMTDSRASAADREKSMRPCPFCSAPLSDAGPCSSCGRRAAPLVIERRWSVLAFRVVFVPGLAERMFPQKPREDPMLLDQEMRVPLDAGLPVQKDRAGTERLLLRLAIGAATERLWLSYPRLDVAGARTKGQTIEGMGSPLLIGWPGFVRLRLLLCQ